MNYNETLNFIHSLGNFSLPSGLDRIKKVLTLLGNPQNAFKSIHIAGTNGKGSAAAFVSSVFKEAGYKTGSFISPFIIEFRERIQINGEYISEKDLISYSQRVRDTNIRLTEFEFITALGFLYFKDQCIDILVCETGLGGRLDATNTLENLSVCVITKIGFDHTAVLGDTIEKITEEKCGILRDCPTVTTPYQDPKALTVIRSHTDNLIIPDINRLQMKNTHYIYKGEKFEVSLLGDFQIENSLVAIEAIRNSGYNIPYHTIYSGIKNTFLPARLEVIRKEPLILLDGAHNPDGAEALSKELEKLNKKPIAIVGMMRDKNINEVLEAVLKHCDAAICVTVPDNPRAISGEELYEIANKYCPCTTVESLDDAIKITENQDTVIFGSLYLASQIRKKLI